jgi:EpsD family peptidyl-prolyl cis-trans isomerase
MNQELQLRGVASFGGIAVVVLSALLLSACGGGKDKASSQVAVKVNKEEISVHQINFVLQQQRGLRPDQAEGAGRQVLERLVDQELAVQKAQELKLDRDPRVLQQVEAARREIVARAYLEKTGEAATKPSPEEIKKYYDDKPALFKERRVYNLQELTIEAPADQIEALRAQMQAAKSAVEFVEYLKAKGVKFAVGQAVRPAEQLPLSMLDTFSRMKDGQSILVPTPTGAQVIVLASSRSEPVDAARAQPAIEQFLQNEARRKLIEADMKAMRAAAKIEYVGKFAEGMASAPAGGAATPAAPAAEAAPASAAAQPASAAKGGLSAEDISKGLGIK